MFRFLLVFPILQLGLVSAAFAQEFHGFDHAGFDSVLSRFVDANGRVDYAGLKRDPAGLERYVAGLARMGPKTAPHLFPTRADSLTYWINAYNACVLKGVVEAYPVSSVLKIGLFHGFFKRKKFRVDGQDLTLDHIEHDTIRKQFDDPRIHAAVNCAAMSRPKLYNEAFVPERLEAQLHRGMQSMVASPEYVRLDKATQVIHLSRIFDWFKSDFATWYARQHGVQNATVVDYIRLFCDEDTKLFLERYPDVRIHYNDYDWSLNEQ